MTRLARLALILLMFVVGSTLSLHADPVSAPGQFSYTPPAGWTVKTLAASKFPVVLGPVSNNFSPNLNVVAEAYAGTLDQYVEANKQFLQSSSMFTNLKFHDQTPFVTDAGVKGVRLVTTDTVQQMDLQQIFYFFPASKNMLVVTASSLAAQGDQMTPTFDACMKSFVPQ